MKDGGKMVENIGKYRKMMEHIGKSEEHIGTWRITESHR
jgi:hypothetical protein